MNIIQILFVKSDEESIISDDLEKDIKKFVKAFFLGVKVEVLESITES